MHLTKLLIFSALLIPLALKANTGIQSSYSTTHHKFTSKIVERDFHLLVETPKEMGENVRYPTIYLLDGGITFSLLSGYYRYLRLQGSVPEAIIVGIAYPGETFEQGNYRSTDYTAPSAERSYWGGAERFQKVLKQEVFSFIEKTYPSDKEQRVLFGQSIGGQFVLYCAQTEPSLFSGYIASNAALHRNLESFLTDYKIDSSRLYASSAANDEARFRQPLLSWFQHIEQSEVPNIKTETLDDQGHFTAAPEAFRRGLRWWSR